MAYNKEFVEKWLSRFHDVILENKEYLSELDTPIGDQDHGFNMARGVEAYNASIAKAPAKDCGDAFAKLAMAMLSKVGGASGPLYGSAFLALGKVLRGKEEFTDQDLAAAVTEGLKAIQGRGHAHEGEKTMVDVWAPVSRALTAGKLTLGEIDGFVEATKPLKATKGRASYLGDRSIGHIDPGAASSGIFFRTFLQTK